MRPYEDGSAPPFRINVATAIMSSPSSLHAKCGGNAVSGARTKNDAESNADACLSTVYVAERGRRHVWRLYRRYWACMRRSQS